MFEVEINSIKIKTKIGVSSLERNKEQILNVSLKFNYNLFVINSLIFLLDSSVTPEICGVIMQLKVSSILL